MQPWQIFLFAFLFSCVYCQSLPNDAEYFWCSQLYNPYYPLDPLNVSLPLINGTGYFSYPQPTYKVLTKQSLFSNTDKVGELIITINSTQCKCSSVFVKITKNATTLGEETILSDKRTFVPFSLDALEKNQTTEILCSFYSSPAQINLLGKEKIKINIFSVKEQQVYIDYSSMGLKVFEKPWIPVGFYYSWSNTEKFIALAVDEVRNAMQSLLPYRPPTPPESSYLDYLSLANEMRTRVHFDMYSLSEEADSPEKWEKIRQTVQSIKNRDGLLAYYIADEPDGAGFGLDPSLLKQVYDTIKQEDPYHPVTIVLNCIHSAPRYIDCADVIMVDPYPIGLSQPVGCDHCAGDPLDVANRVDLITKEINGTKPIWVVLQAFGGPGEHWNRLPTWQEERAMSYLSIIHGATGIQYFLEGIPYSRAVWAECRKVSLELNALTPAILSSDEPPTVTSSTSQVHVAGFHEEEKFCYTIMVANAINSPTLFSIEIDELATSQNLDAIVFFEDREIPVSQGRITDMILGFGTHVYRIYYAQSANGPSVNPGNLLRNPSFEEQSSAGMADAMWPAFSVTNSGLIDPNYAYHGYYSQRLTNTGLGTDAFAQVQSYIVALAPSVSYRVSFAVFTNDNIGIVLSNSCDSLTTTFAIKSGSWNEYSTIVSFDNPGQCKFSLKFSNKGTVWIDLWQVYSI